MTALSVIQAASKWTGIDVPTSAMASTARELVELVETMLEAAQALARSRDWTKLRVEATIAGDGATRSFALPADYDRMPKRAQVRSSRLLSPYTRISSDEWLQLTMRSWGTGGVWSMFGGSIYVDPTPATGETLKYHYQTAKIWASSAGVAKTAATADDDVFQLDERVLRLGVVWLWKAAKGLPYEEDLASYEQAVAEVGAADGGPRMITVGHARLVGGRAAFPWEVYRT